MSTKSPNRTALLLLAAIGTITPLAIDLYLPALPTISTLLDVPMQRIESSVSTYMIGLAIGVLIGATVSDRFGRKPSVTGGLILFVVCSIGVGLTTNPDVFLALRVVQAFGGGFAFVNIPAIVRDLYDEQDSARAFTMITILALIAPLIAPTIGAAIMTLVHWRAIFFFLAAYGATLCALVAIYLPETSPADPARRELGILTQVRANVRRVFSKPEAVALVFCQSFVFAVMFSFVADASFVYMVHFGLSAWHFSVLFAANIFTLMAFNRANKRLLVNRRPFEIVYLGIAVQVLSTVGLVVVTLLGFARLELFVPLMMLAVGAHAMITPNLTATFMARFEHGAGTASGVITGAQYLMAGLVSVLAAVVHDGTLRTTVLTMMISAFIGWGGFLLARTRRNERLAAEPA
ncbi:MAG: multidrug effflux MFS transporter [Gammaproteobacteria bacterium]